MSNTFPGTTIEVLSLRTGSSRMLFDGVFATGGITLSQVSVMTGLEPYLIQNWVKRGFVSAPQNRVYSRSQFARIVIINMLRESLQLDRICGLIRVIQGIPEDSSDDLISDDELYHRYVDLLCSYKMDVRDPGSVQAAVQAVALEWDLTGKRANQLASILQVMLYAHAASEFRRKSEETLALLL